MSVLPSYLVFSVFCIWQLPPCFPSPFIIQVAVAWMPMVLEPNSFLRCHMQHHWATRTIANCLHHDILQRAIWAGVSNKTSASLWSTSSLWCGEAGGVWLVMNMYWQQMSSRGSAWSGMYMDVYSVRGWLARQAGRQAGRWEWSSGAVCELCLDVCIHVQHAGKRPLTPKVVLSHAWLTAW